MKLHIHIYMNNDPVNINYLGGPGLIPPYAIPGMHFARTPPPRETGFFGGLPRGLGDGFAFASCESEIWLFGVRLLLRMVMSCQDPDLQDSANRHLKPGYKIYISSTSCLGNLLYTYSFTTCANVGRYICI